jgi:hypothetical protein
LFGCVGHRLSILSQDNNRFFHASMRERRVSLSRVGFSPQARAG